MIGEIWESLGSTRFLMAFSFVAIVSMIVWSVGQLARPGATADPRTKAWVDGILFWGGFAAISGMLGSLIGIIVAFQNIERAGEVTPTLVAGGVKVGLLSTSLGLVILGFAALAWFPLQLRWRFLLDR